MLVHGSFDRVRENFADQFEPVGDKFLYRPHAKGAPIRVSAAERERYIAAFNRFLRIAKWAIVGGVIVFGLAIAVLQAKFAFSKAIDTAAIWGVMALIVAVFMGFYLRAYGAPARDLRDRYPEGGERSREEVQRHNLKRIGYGRIVLPLVLVAALLAFAVWKSAPLSGEDKLWLVAIVVSVAFLLFTLFRKWRFEVSEKQ